MGLVGTALTPADLLTMPRPPNGRHYELSKGELIVVGNAGARHERIKGRIAKMLIVWAAQSSLGEVFSESQFTLGDDTARIPDVAFVGNARVALVPDSDVPIPIAPDLAVEVISVSESAANAESKVHEYLSAGVQEVWQVYPRESGVRVRTSGGIRDFGPDQTLTSLVLPGFACAVKAFFGDEY